MRVAVKWFQHRTQGTENCMDEMLTFNTASGVFKKNEYLNKSVKICGRNHGIGENRKEKLLTCKIKNGD